MVMFYELTDRTNKWHSQIPLFTKHPNYKCQQKHTEQLPVLFEVNMLADGVFFCSHILNWTLNTNWFDPVCWLSNDNKPPCHTFTMCLPATSCPALLLICASGCVGAWSCYSNCITVFNIKAGYMNSSMVQDNGFISRTLNHFRIICVSFARRQCHDHASCLFPLSLLSLLSRTTFAELLLLLTPLGTAQWLYEFTESDLF